MSDKTFRDREILSNAHERGMFSTGLAFLRLSGPGWLQSAITLGGGSLVGALYLGMLAGTSMLWLQLVAIVIGVIMLSAISYVTLSTRQRPYEAINTHVNPVLGVGWLTGTILANMIFIIPQFSLCYDALDRNLLIQPLTAEQTATLEAEIVALQSGSPAGEDLTDATDSQLAALNAKLDRATSGLGDATQTKLQISLAIAVVAFLIILMSFNPGWMSKIFDLILKLIVATVVVCFVGVVYYLTVNGSLDWLEIAMGFIPDLRQWNSPAPAIQDLLINLDGGTRKFWEDAIIEKQQQSIIGVTATAVGLNMTFLLPYSMLARGWDKPFRGLARFDLITAMAISYLIVTTCIVIASAYAFHAKADENFLSDDPAQIQKFVLFDNVAGVLESRMLHSKTAEEQALLKSELNGQIDRLAVQLGTAEKSDAKNADQVAKLKAELKQAKAEKHQRLAEFAATLNADERKLAPTLVKPNANQLAATLKPFLGENKQYADLIFGLGALGMGFSTIIILGLINGYAFSEMFGRPQSTLARTLGAFAAIAVGACWFLIWQGASRTWLGVVASTFAAILLPIAYIAFFAMMNNRSLLGDEKPTGVRMSIWNTLMAIGVAGACLQAYGAVEQKVGDPTFPYIVGGLAVFLLLTLIGFSARRPTNVAN